MSHRSAVNPTVDSLPSWISDHLGEGSSYVTDEVRQSPRSPMEDQSVAEVIPVDNVHPSVTKEHNTMTLEELGFLRETYSIPQGVQLRLPEEGETILSARPGEVAFYEAAFPAGLRFPIPIIIRSILLFYNICPAQLVPNAWRSIVGAVTLWRVHKFIMTLSEFRNIFSLTNNPKPDQGWLYFKARYKKTILTGYPSNVKGWKSRFFFASGDNWELFDEEPRTGVPRIPRSWGIPGRFLFCYCWFII